MLRSLKIGENLRFASIGWLGGIGADLILGLVWPAIFPEIVRRDHFYGTIPGLAFIVGTALVITSPFACVGGLIGSRLPTEGGDTEERIVAALGGAILVIPFACYSMWLLTGF